MIRYALVCGACDAEFEAWFASSEAYDEQRSRKLVSCASCGSHRVDKQIMAPAVSASRKREAVAKEAAKLAKAAREFIAETHDYVGDQFPDEARAMHYGDIDTRPIWGEAGPEDRAALEDEGVGVAPLPPQLVPDKPIDPEKLN